MIEQTLYFDNKLADSKTGVIDKDACKKFITSNIKDKSWEKVIQAAFTKCSTEAIKYGEQYQIHTGIERETCDFKFDAISDCIDIASLSVSLISFLSFFKKFFKIILEMSQGLVDQEGRQERTL